MWDGCLECAPGEQNRRMLIIESLMTLITASVVVIPLAMALMIIGASDRRQAAKAVVRVDSPTARRPRS
jgi:hypothetical protein